MSYLRLSTKDCTPSTLTVTPSMAQLLPPTELQPPREEFANIDSGRENLQPLEEIQKQRLALG